MTGLVFVDTNVLVHSADASEPEKQEKARGWRAHLWATRTGRLSFQVLQEFCTTVTDKLKSGLARESACSEVRSLLPWRPIPTDSRVMAGAWVIQDRFKLSWWDAFIVSAAQVANCEYLLTEALQDKQEPGNVRVLSPFKTSAAALAK
jgi:predicted nucleic acid-binding protein